MKENDSRNVEIMTGECDFFLGFIVKTLKLKHFFKVKRDKKNLSSIVILNGYFAIAVLVVTLYILHTSTKYADCPESGEGVLLLHVENNR